MSGYVYIGCRTTKERNARGEGISVYRILPDSSWELLEVFRTEEENPSYLCFDSRKRFLYAVHGDKEKVSSYRIKEDGTLELTGTVSGIGRNPVYITVSPDDRFAYTASLQGGCLQTLRMNSSMVLAEVIDTKHIAGRGEGQYSLAHHCLMDAAGHYLFVPTVGRTTGYGGVHIFLIGENGIPIVSQDLPARPYDDPRHAALHPNGRWLYVANEINSSVVFYRFDRAKGLAEAVQLVSTLPEGSTEYAQPSEIWVHPNGRFLYAANRLVNTVAVFAVRETTGELKRIGEASCFGKNPRFTCFGPDASTFYVGNEDTDTIEEYHVNPESGVLTHTGTKIHTPSPTCIVFR